jgi:hypothetical protein
MGAREVTVVQVAKQDPQMAVTAAKQETAVTAAKQETAVWEDKRTVGLHLAHQMQAMAALLREVMAAILMAVAVVQLLVA